MRPDIVAEPMLRTPSPETAALSKLCAAAAVPARIAEAAVARRIERSILLAPLRRGGRTGLLACRARLLGPGFALRLHRGVGRLGRGLGKRRWPAGLHKISAVDRRVRQPGGDQHSLALVG